MSIILRPYQVRAVDEVRAAFKARHNSVLFQLPTGGGKTLTSGYILGSAAAKGNGTMFICNRVELVEQTAEAFSRLNIRFGVIAAGWSPNPLAMTQIASIDTLKNRLDKIRLPKLVAWDECRGLGAAGWTRVFNFFRERGVKQLGLDATPIRLDRKPMGEFFTHLVHGPRYSELMELGSLVPFDCYAPGVPDLSGVRTKGHDFDQEQAAALMDKPQLVGDAVRHYLAHADGKLGITFAVNRKHSEHLAEAFRASGVPAAHLDGDTDKGERKRTVEAFRRRELRVLTNVNLFSAGFDVPGVEVITDCAPTQSLSMFLQRAGRGSRPDEENPAKDRCILLDHAGNVLRHGLPDMDRDWSLDAPPKRTKKKKADDGEEVNVRQCQSCYAVYSPPTPTCPKCGHVHAVKREGPEQVDGQLQKITKEQAAALAAQKKRELKKARTLEELQEIEKARGYQEGWAKATYATRRRAAAQHKAEAQARAYGGRW